MDNQTPLPVTAVYDEDVNNFAKHNLSEIQVTLIPSPLAPNDFQQPSAEGRTSSSPKRLSTNAGDAEQQNMASSLIPPGVLSYDEQYSSSAGFGGTHGNNNNNNNNDANIRVRNTHHFEKKNYNNDIPVEDAASGAVLIYPKRIDDFRRFRMLYVGLLLFISSSIQGVQPVFAVLLMEVKYNYTVSDLTNLYTVGAALGMFVFPFGAFYDWFGPRLMVMLGTALIVLSCILFGLMFGGHMEQTVTRSCIFYGIMSWGSYALDVVTLPTIMTHMPRDRSQPTGLLKTFSGLGASFLSCLYRGFFLNHFDQLMWFIASLALAIGVLGSLYLENAPYVVTRWQQRTLTPHNQLRCYLMRNRYMSQRVPQLRFFISEAILIILNVYMTAQAIYAGYDMNTLSDAQFRVLAIVAILITVSTVVLALPFSFLDSKSYDDTCLIETAKEKEKRLLSMKKQDRGNVRDGSTERLDNSMDTLNRRAQDHNNNYYDSSLRRAEQIDSTAAIPAVDNTSTTSPNARDEQSLQSNTTAGSAEAHRKYCSDPSCEREPVEEFDTNGNNDADTRINAQEERTLIVVDVLNDSEAHSNSQMQANATDYPQLQMNNNNSNTTNVLAGRQQQYTNVSMTNPLNILQMRVTRRAISTHDNPTVETITQCGEVYVVPLYQTTFLQSLTYIDLWLMFFTTMITWGVGLTMTANWNIKVMVGARDAALDYKLYVLYSSLSGVSLAGGRVSLALYETVINILRDRGVSLTYTVGYTWPSIIMLISTILWIALPGNNSLIIAYMVGSYGYGLSTSITIYILQTIFDRDMGMHYGFCFTGAAIGIVFFFRLAWFIPYDNNSQLISAELGKLCVGQRKCMNTTLIVYIVFLFISIFTSYVVHYRYNKLVNGKLKHRRVIVPVIRRLFNRL